MNSRTGFGSPLGTRRVAAMGTGYPVRARTSRRGGPSARRL